MHRIDGLNATVDHKFTEGDPVVGTPPTQVTDDWLNDQQENSCGVVEFSGQTLSKGDSTQLRKAIAAMSWSGGQGGLWQEPSGAAPLSIDEYSGKVWKFEAAGTSKLVMFFKVPKDYIAGKQIKMDIGHYSPSTSGTQLLQATSYLIRPNVDAISSSANSYASTNLALTNTVQDQYRISTLDITDGTGKINSVSVTAGAIIRIELSRGSDTDVADIRFVGSSTEIKA